MRIMSSPSLSFHVGKFSLHLASRHRKNYCHTWAPCSTTVAPMDLMVLLRRYGISKPYVIAFSSSSPNKNIPRLVQAFVQARRDYGLPHQLVLVGHKPQDELTNESSAVVLTGYMDEPSKQALLAGAEMLVFPSTYEGFGLPVLEAQQAGVPVACSTAASLPEVAGDGAEFFDPHSTEAIAQTIARCLLDDKLRTELRFRGQENLRRFSSEKTASQTLAIYKHVLDQRRTHLSTSETVR